ncbi:MAG: glycosyl transferase group 1, partial [Sarcina sp.]
KVAFEKKYGIKKENAFIITRGYDKKAYENIKKEKKPKLLKDNKINLVYTGEIFSKLRDVTPFISALNKIKDSNKELYNKINILFFGNIDSYEIKEKLKAIDIVKVNDRINYKEALKYMIHSDVLLVFGNKNSKQIPAKIYDYLGAEKPILIILGDEKDPIKNIVSTIDKCKVCNNTLEEITYNLNNIVYDIESGKVFNECNEYEWENVTYRLNNILNLK